MIFVLTTLSFCCFPHKPKISIMIKCHMCLYVFFWDIVVMMIYNGHLNSTDDLLAKFISREYSWFFTGTHPLTWNNLSHCVYPRIKDQMVCIHFLIVFYISEVGNFIYLLISLFKKSHSNHSCSFPCELPIKSLQGLNGAKNTDCWCNQQVIQAQIFHSDFCK